MTSLAYGLGTASWDHYANGLIARQTLPNGAWTDYAYDGANRIRQLINKDPSGAVLAAYGDTDYLPTGDLAAWTAEVTGEASQSGAIAYDYDRKRRLIEETSTRLGGYDYDNSFDEAGNALEFRNDPHTYNADNQLVGPGTYVYDGNGNPTTWDSTALTWNVENRMTAYGSTLTAAYRGDNLRAWKQTSSGTTYFLYDGINIVCELDGSGSVTAQSVFGANGLLSRGSVQYQFDPLGDATLLLDGSENVTAYRLFDAWGNELSSGSTDPRGCRAKYGYYTDVETGLVALAFRYYAPGMGRFVNRDPIGYAGGVGLYGYAGGDPVLRVDRDGRSWMGWATGNSVLCDPPIRSWKTCLFGMIPQPDWCLKCYVACSAYCALIWDTLHPDLGELIDCLDTCALRHRDCVFGGVYVFPPVPPFGPSVMP